jgi:UPF0716 family protein affecting phage T7 exclusion
VPILFFLLLAVPIAELWVIVQVAGEIGVLETLALLILISIAGAYLLRQQGLAAWARMQTALAEGRVPASEVADGAMIMFGGALLLTPGFLTDIVGLMLLIPPTRAVVKIWFRRILGGWAARRYVPPGGRIYSATVIRSKSTDASRRSPSSELQSGADDSPDKE